MKYLIANWKAQITLPEAGRWVESFLNELEKMPQLERSVRNHELEIIICPPFPYLLYVKQALSRFPQIRIGAQSLSHEKEGKFTGEVTAKALMDIVSYAIIGHSERRQHFGETDIMIEKKLHLAEQFGVKPILCIRDTQDSIPLADAIVAYEPVSAIGTGHHEDPRQVVRMKSNLGIDQSTPFLYGGSVDTDSIGDYLSHPEIRGFLVGTASLDPVEFAGMGHKMISSSEE